MDFNFLRFALIGGIQAALVLVAGHYFPWQKITGKPLPILWRYIYGIISVCFIGYPVALAHIPIVTSVNAIITLVVVSCMGGAAVAGCYFLDRFGKVNEQTSDFVDNYKDAYEELKNVKK
jgi:uncharacterized membrane protein AbrB (regulator of aidB expression)